MTAAESNALLLAALHFAATRHSPQRRKDVAASPYINHPIAVAELLSRVAQVTEPDILLAAVLHDVLEDTPARAEEIAARFGPRVTAWVQEVTDDKRLPQAERKQRQVEHAPHLSREARLIKLADKTHNVGDFQSDQPVNWSQQRKLQYLDWAERVVAGLRGVCPPLEALFDQTLVAKRALLQA
jgi:guanosine-3',5'-bis(diphosphate) 3'-pyrophosphohydrolase